MPIAVLDAVHILSEFFDHYQESKDRRKTILSVMRTLFKPMLYTTLTTAVGFASLALTPIPPVQIFGLFVAFGVLTAWIWTILFIPAYIVLLPERLLKNFGHAAVHGGVDDEDRSPLSRALRRLGVFTFRHARLILIATAALVVVAIYGIGLIRINDNPTKWFNASHPIRVADKVLNQHFGGTYMGYLALEPEEAAFDAEAALKEMEPGRLHAGSIFFTYFITALTMRDLGKPSMSPMRVVITCFTSVLSTIFWRTEAELAKITMALAPESFNWCSSSRAV